MTKTYIQNLVMNMFDDAGLDPAFGCAIVEHESRWNSNARSPVSASDEKYGGAWGLCQILLTTAKDLGYTGDGPGLWDPKVNTELFIKLTLRNLHNLHIVSVQDLIAAHNSGKTYNNSPASTRNEYVPQVLDLYRRWNITCGTLGSSQS